MLEYTKILQDILNSKKDRVRKILDFQKSIFDDSNKETDSYILDLVIDLDYYEPDEKQRTEEPSFYGDDKLEEILKNAIEYLNNKYKNEHD